MTSEAPTQPETPAKPSFDELVAVVTGWLRLLVEPDEVVELRALKCQASNYRKPHKHLIHIKVFDLPEQEKKLVLDTRGIVWLGEAIAKRYLDSQ